MTPRAVCTRFCSKKKSVWQSCNFDSSTLSHNNGTQQNMSNFLEKVFLTFFNYFNSSGWCLVREAKKTTPRFNYVGIQWTPQLLQVAIFSLLLSKPFGTDVATCGSFFWAANCLGRCLIGVTYFCWHSSAVPLKLRQQLKKMGDWLVVSFLGSLHDRYQLLVIWKAITHCDHTKTSYIPHNNVRFYTQ